MNKASLKHSLHDVNLGIATKCFTYYQVGQGKERLVKAILNFSALTSRLE